MRAWQVIFIAVSNSCCYLRAANPGSVDETFTPAPVAGAAITRIALQSDGKILAGGQFGFARFDAVGNVDPTFSPPYFDGSDVQFLAEVPGGKILASKSSGAIVRWHSDGSVDSSFAPLTYSASRIDVLTVQPDGRITRSLSSQSGYSFERLNLNGRADFSFNPFSYSDPGGTMGGVRSFVATALPDGKILAGADSLFRIHFHGAPDRWFQAGLSPGLITALAAQPDGKVFVAGTFTNIQGTIRRGLVLLKPDGALDTEFDPMVPPLGTIQTMTVQSDGKLLVGGTFTNVGSTAVNRLARLNTDGSLDLTFDIGSGASNTVSAIVIQPDGKILVAGNFTQFNGFSRRRIVRLHGDPPEVPFITRHPASQSAIAGESVRFSVQSRSAPNPTYQWFFNEAPLPDETNSVLAANSAGAYFVLITNAFGAATSHVAHLTLTPSPTNPGAPDLDFSSSADSTIRVIARQSTGKFIVAGWFNHIHNVPRPGIARLNQDGSLDLTFDPGLGPDGRILCLAVDANDRILVGGSFRNFDGVPRSLLARLLPDGQLDTFDVAGWIGGGASAAAVNALALQPDGKIIVGGQSLLYNLIRFTSDGTRDMSFSGQGPSSTLCLALQADGKIVVGGTSGLYRLHPNGAVDFPSPGTPGPILGGRVQAVLIQRDGSIIAAGAFASYHYGIARLDPSGALDMHFAYQLLIGPTSVETLAQHPCGKILLGGYFGLSGATPYHLARLNPDGTLDRDFAPKALDGRVFGLLVDETTRIMMVGEFSKVDHVVRNGIAHLHGEVLGPPVLFSQPVSQTSQAGREVRLVVAVTNCSDFTFQWQRNGVDLPNATNATLTFPNIHTFDAGDYRVIIRNGPYVTISDSAQIQVVPEARQPGSADIDFFPPANVNGWVHALAIDPSRNLLAGGSFTRIGGNAANRVARFNANGQFDRFFRPDSNMVGTVYALAVQADGRILAAGSHPGPYLLVRLWPNGQLDTGFFRPRGTNAAYAVDTLPDGKILLAGVFTAEGLGGGSRSGVARLLTNGNLDNDFAAGGVRYPLAMALGNDGKIILSGTFTLVGQVPRARVARLLPSGATDLTFDPGAGPNSVVNALASTRDEKVYIAGNFTEVAGIPRRGIARLQPDGRVDLSFDPGLGVNAVWAMVVQPNDKILVVGSFRFAGGLPRWHCAL